MELQKQLTLDKTGQKTYDGHVARFGVWLSMQGKQINKETIADFLAELSDNRSAATVSNYKQAIKKALSMRVHMIADKALLDALFSNLKIAKQDKKVTQLMVVGDKEAQGIESQLHGIYKLVYKALAQTGLRVSELINIKRKDCIETKEAIAVRVLGKGKKERTVYFTKQLYKQIQAISTSDTWLFCGRNGARLYRQNVHITFARAGSRAGVHFTPHKLRHTFATKQIKARGSVKAVSLYLGHASTATTETMYVHDELTPGEALRFAG